MMNQSRAEYFAVELMDAYMHPDVPMRPAYVMRVFSESHLTAEAFELANVTAWAAAEFWLRTNPRLGRQLLEEKRAELAKAVA